MDNEILEILKEQLEVYTFKGKTYNHEITIIRFTDDRLSLNDLNMDENKFKKLLDWLER
jgi:hypothetical protein